jgi:hypothetical protein
MGWQAMAAGSLLSLGLWSHFPSFLGAVHNKRRDARSWCCWVVKNP